jgi:hypothetical protein
MELGDFGVEIKALAEMLDVEISEATEISKAYQLKRIADALGRK